MGVLRPVLRYHGGKWRIAPWLIGLMPPHNVYIEPFGGGASVLLRKDRSPAELYNDLDGQIVNVFRVLQKRDQAAELQHRLVLTPYSRAEFDRSYEPATDCVDAACKTIVRSFFGVGSDTATRKHRSGFGDARTSHRAFSATAWRNWHQHIPQTHSENVA